MLTLDELRANTNTDILGYKPKYAWVGVPCNAWEDKVWDILPLNVIQKDIEDKTSLIKSGETLNYGQLDIMHNHSLTVGDWQYRAIVDGTRMEIGFGYFYPQFNSLAKELVDKPLTMSIEFNCMINDPLRKQKSIISSDQNGMRSLFSIEKMWEFVTIDVYRATLARVGAEANPRTIAKVIEI